MNLQIIDIEDYFFILSYPALIKEWFTITKISIFHLDNSTRFLYRKGKSSELKTGSEQSFSVHT